MSHLAAFRLSLAENGADAAIISTDFNQHYLSAFRYDDGYVLVTPKKAYLLVDFRYEEAARAQASSEFEIIRPDGSMLICLSGLLSENGCKRAIIEDHAVSLELYQRMKKAFDGVAVEGGASELLQNLRVKKDAEELEKIARAQKMTDAAFSHILSVMTPDMTEMEVALELEHFMRRHGADGLAFSTIAVSGSASSLPHGVPRPVKLERGFLTMDFGAKCDGYCSDMTRTVVIGKADADMKKLYQTVLTAQKAALDAAAEGVSCHALDRVARDVIENAGYKGRFGHSLGHGVGMLIHEMPCLAPSVAPDQKLMRGHVVTVEPGIYIAGQYGCRIEDMIAVTPDGAIRNFTQSQKELIELF